MKIKQLMQMMQRVAVFMSLFADVKEQKEIT